MTVSGTVEVATMTVDAADYSFTGGTIALANAAVTVNADSTTVGSVLDGGNGLVKNGAGSLTLSGANTFTGLVNITAGRLAIAADSALGNAANDVAISGTLATSANVSLGVGRDVTGSATLDIAAGTALEVAGSYTASATTLVNTGTLDLQGATRTVGTLTLDAPATVNGSGAITVTNVVASGLTSGTATIGSGVTYASSGDKTLTVGSGGTLAIAGDVAGTSGRLLKVGAGTLVLSGSNGTGGLRIGSSGTAPTDGGTVVLDQAASAGTSQLQLNYGTLRTAAEGGLTLANGVSMGGRTGAVAVFGGTENLTVSGTSNFFRGTGTSGELRVDVNNDTEFAGVFAATSGVGTATGITFGGSGSLTFSGDAAALVDPIKLQDTLDLLVTGTLGSGVTVGATNVIGGDGTILGSLALNAGAQLLFEIGKTLTVDGASVTFGDFGVSDLLGFSAATPDGTYVLIDGVADIDTANLRNLGFANAYDLAPGRKAYFTEGSLVLHVVPEPGAVALAGLGGLLAAGYALRRRKSMDRD